MNKITLGFFLTKSKTTIKGLFVLFVFLLMNSQASWGQVFTEDFNYTNATTLVSNGWAAHSGAGTNSILVSSPTISYSGYASSSVGSEVTMVTSGEDVNKTFTPQTTGTIYTSFLVNVNSATTTGDYFFNVGASTIGTAFRGRIFVKRDASNNVSFGISQSTTTVNYSSAIYALNTTYLIVLKYDIVSGPTNDTASIFVNPPLNFVIPSTGWIVNTDAAGTDLANLGSIALRQGTASTAAGLKLDGIRVSTAWSDIVGLVTSTTWTGSFWSNGTPTASLDAIIAGPYSAAADITAKSLTVNNSAVANIPSGTNVTVAGAVTVTAPATLTFSNNANLIQDPATTTNSNVGAITVNRNSNSLLRKDYTLWSSPVGSQNLAAFSPLTSQSPSRFYTYDSANNEYTNTASAVLDPTTTNFTPGAGYLIRMPNENPAILGTLSDYYLGNAAITYNGVFTGIPNNGDVPVALSTAGAGAYNLVGNPYPSTINLFTLQSNNASVIGNTFYMWRKTNGLGTAYCSYVPTTATTGTYVSNNNIQSAASFVGDIQSGQGFFVSALTTGPLVFKNEQRGTTASSFFKTKQAAASNKIWLNATNAAGDFSQMAVTYFDGATSGVDAFDGKYINDSAFALTSNVNNGEYTIQGRPAFDVADVVSLNFKTELAGEYTIALDHSEGVFAAGQDIYLVDSKTGAETNLKTSSYNFTATAGVDNTRFSLKYQKTLKVEDAILSENNVTVYAKNGTLYVNSGAVAISTIQVYDVQGRLIAERKNVKATAATLENLNANSQVLLVKVSGENNQIVTKKVVN